MIGKVNIGKTSRMRRTNGVNAHLPDALFNDFDASIKLQHEKPVHRRIIGMAQNGYTHKEIARLVGMAPQYISMVLRQPWARQQIVNDLKKSVQDELRELLEAEAKPALERVVELSKNAEDERVRSTNNQYLVDRLLGKPTQPVKDETTEPEKLSYDELERRVATIASRLPGDSGVGTPEG